MNKYFVFLVINILFIPYFYENLFCQNKTIKLIELDDNEVILIIDHELHIDYGFKYPITFIFKYNSFEMPQNVYSKNSFGENWKTIIKKTSNDFYNGVEVVRYDYASNSIYLSMQFSETTDTLYIKFETNQNNLCKVTFISIAKYYDNRKAVVTSSLDDYETSLEYVFYPIMSIFRYYKVPMTVGMITSYINKDSWNYFNMELDSGFVEAASHSRTHSLGSTNDELVNEIVGSKDDICNNLNLPFEYRFGSRQYVYCWLPPYGQFTNQSEIIVNNAKYIITRLTGPGYNTISNFNYAKDMFFPVGVSVEIGSVPWGGAVNDLDSLNNYFNKIYLNGGVYHIICHPAFLVLDIANKKYLIDHLKYISQKKDIWYATLGQIYLYQYFKDKFEDNGLANTESNKICYFILNQNYPNPFSKASILTFYIWQDCYAAIYVYDINGKEIKKTPNRFYSKGSYSFQFEGANLASGIYFCQIRSKNYFSQIIKMTLLK